MGLIGVLPGAASHCSRFAWRLVWRFGNLKLVVILQPINLNGGPLQYANFGVGTGGGTLCNGRQQVGAKVSYFYALAIVSIISRQF